MAKKSRRERRAQAAKSSPAKTRRSQQPATTPTAPVEQATDLARDYYYVYNDVRTLLIVTAVMIVVMFGLSFVI